MAGPLLPVDGGWISQYFGPTDETLDSGAFGYAHFNKGVDFAVDADTPIRNIVKGTVISVGDSGDGWGYSIKIKLDDGRIVNYGHLQQDSAYVKVGQRVNGGEILGRVGSTGASRGAHLSFDVLAADGTPLDPSDILGFNAARDNRQGGGSMGTSSSSGPQLFRQPNKEMLDSLKKARDQLWQKIQDYSNSDDPVKAGLVSQLLLQWQDLTVKIDSYEATGYLSPSDATSAIATAIELGMLDLNKASQLFTEWSTKEAGARELASKQIQSAIDWNTMAQELNSRPTYGHGYRPSVYQVPADFDAAYEKWRGKLGVGDAPSVADVDPTRHLQTDRSVSSQQSVPYSGELPATSPHISGPAADLLDKFRPLLKEITAKDEAPRYNGKPWYELTEKEKRWLLSSDPELYWAGRKWEKNHAQPKSKPSNGAPKTKPATFNFSVDGKTVPITYDVPVGKNVSYPEDTWGKDNPNWWELSIKSSVEKANKAREEEQKKQQKKSPWWKKLPGLAAGGQNIPPGAYAVGEQGPETVVGPAGEMAMVGQGGPEVAQFNQPGFDVLPADVPPEQAYLYAKYKRMLAEEQATGDGKQLMEQQQRANDPDLQQKVMDAVMRALADVLAANPPKTPTLVGDGWTDDPWSDFRELSGIGPDGMPLAQSSGMPRIEQQPLMAPGIPGTAPAAPAGGMAGVGLPNLP